MRILVYHGKHEDEYWLADTPKRLEAALQKLFTKLDGLGCYTEDEFSRLALEKAREGDACCIRQILNAHKGCEYEDWDLKEVYDPCTA